MTMLRQLNRLQSGVRVLASPYVTASIVSVTLLPAAGATAAQAMPGSARAVAGFASAPGQSSTQAAIGAATARAALSAAPGQSTVGSLIGSTSLGSSLAAAQGLSTASALQGRSVRSAALVPADGATTAATRGGAMTAAAQLTAAAGITYTGFLRDVNAVIPVGSGGRVMMASPGALMTTHSGEAATPTAVTHAGAIVPAVGSTVSSSISSGGGVKTITYSATHPAESVDIDQFLDLQLFDTSMGALIGASLTMTSSLSGSITMSLGAGGSTSTLTGKSTCYVYFTSFNAALDALINTGLETVKTQCTTGPVLMSPGTSHTASGLYDSKSTTVSADSILADLQATGGGLLQMEITSAASLSLTGAGPYGSISGAIAAGTSASITYTYT